MRLSHLYLTCCLLFLTSAIVAQNREQQLFNRLAKGKEQVRPEEMVSFKSDYPYAKAILELSDLAKKLAGKMIVDTSPIKSDTTRPIGTNIQSMYWRDALEVILRTNENWYEEDPQYFLVFNIKQGKTEPGTTMQQGQVQAGGQQQTGAQVQFVPPVDSAKVYAETKEVTVSAIFLDVNQTKLHENGISFQIFRGHNLNLGFQFTGAQNVTNQIFTAKVAPTDPRLAVDVNAAIAFFESEGYGEVVSRPIARVRSGASGFVQIGQSVSVLIRDFSGNTTQQFVDAGTKLLVNPKVYKYNNVEFIDLKYNIDKATPTVTATGVSVDHNLVNGELYMLDGERTYVSGLISSSQNTTREGVPLLKDLPWWVFGLRYLFGYEAVNLQKRELIIILDVKLEATVEERAASNAKGTQQSAEEQARKLRQETDKLMKKDK